MKKFKGVLVGVLAGLLLLVLAGCGNSGQSKNSVTIGSQGSDLQIWEHIAKSKQAKDAGLNINVKEITDGTQLNKATTEGQVDVNAFQSWAYYQAYNRENPKGKLAALGTTYLEPLGIYSKKYKKISQIKDGATVAIANNPANTSRGL
jgi:D-methionine transport system substrate-binding protein